MEQLVIILIIGAVSLIKWLMEKSAEAKAQREAAERFEPRERPNSGAATMRPATPPPLPNRDADAAARRLREALGLPEELEEMEWPAPVERRAEPALAPPPAPRKGPVILFERPLPEVSPIVRDDDFARRFVGMEEGPSPIFMPAAPPVKSEAKPAARSGLDELLRSREGLRKAILVQEILGTPKGLVF